MLRTRVIPRAIGFCTNYPLRSRLSGLLVPPVWSSEGFVGVLTSPLRALAYRAIGALAPKCKECGRPVVDTDHEAQLIAGVCGVCRLDRMAYVIPFKRRTGEEVPRA